MIVSYVNLYMKSFEASGKEYVKQAANRLELGGRAQRKRPRAQRLNRLPGSATR